jgi:hypothetical protein
VAEENSDHQENTDLRIEKSGQDNGRSLLSERGGSKFFIPRYKKAA